MKGCWTVTREGLGGWDREETKEMSDMERELYCSQCVCTKRTLLI